MQLNLNAVVLVYVRAFTFVFVVSPGKMIFEVFRDMTVALTASFRPISF